MFNLNKLIDYTHFFRMQQASIHSRTSGSIGQYGLHVKMRLRYKSDCIPKDRPRKNHCNWDRIKYCFPMYFISTWMNRQVSTYRGKSTGQNPMNTFHSKLQKCFKHQTKKTIGCDKECTGKIQRKKRGILFIIRIIITIIIRFMP